MKIVSILFCLIFWACSGTKQNFDSIDFKTADKVSLITTDIDNFWKAFEACQNMPAIVQEKIFDSVYIKNASKCLKEIITINNLTARGFVNQINSEREYFLKCRSVTKKIRSYEDEIIRYLKKLKTIYPAAKYCDIYFMFTQFYTGGQSKNSGIAIGMDFWSLPDSTAIEFKNPLFSELIRRIDVIPVTILHELIHRNQSIKNSGSLLDKCLIEGGADFIAYLVTKKLNNPTMHAIANAREHDLWVRFKKDMMENNSTYWLYNNYDSSRPRDLGYWMGFKICENYYNTAHDKTRAVYEIINIDNSSVFLAASNYGL